MSNSSLVLAKAKARRLLPEVQMNKFIIMIVYFFSQFMNEQNSTNAAIWMVPEVGGIFLLSRWSIFVNERTIFSGNCQSFASFYTSIDD